MNNRDIPILMRRRYALREVDRIARQIQAERDRQLRITQRYDRTGSGGGLPHGLDEMCAAVDELTRQEVEIMTEYARVAQAANGILRGIRDDTLREFVTAYYADGVSLPAAAALIGRSVRWTRDLKQAAERAERLADMDR